MATLHGLDDPEVQQLNAKHNAAMWDPRMDRNLLRKPERIIYVYSTSPRAFVVSRAPLFPKLLLRACPKGERVARVAQIEDPFNQRVHDTATGKFRGEAHDGLRVAIDLLNPNNPTNDPDWSPSGELAAYFSSSKGCDLFAQGLFVSFDEEPSEAEIAKAEERRDRRWLALIAHADSLEQVNRKELDDFLKSEEGADLRLALDHFGEERAYHKPMIATVPCPMCSERIKKGAGFHKSEALGTICVNDWQKAVAAGVKSKDDVPEDHRWWGDAAEPMKGKGGKGGKGTQQASK